MGIQGHYSPINSARIFNRIYGANEAVCCDLTTLWQKTTFLPNDISDQPCGNGALFKALGSRLMNGIHCV